MIKDKVSRKQVEALANNCEEFGITYYGIESDHQGIVHVIGPELGLTKPGMVIVCANSVPKIEWTRMFSPSFWALTLLQSLARLAGR